ncbi:hypothetical protein J2S74_005212 [Evansella vedderi]|uniref:Uncharacterized protein n=1 Tax=Evansella vedderi TaxID=38282 RepID=A0ABU0A3C2_9BACI|nr:hypothetical protein [Evansella vedderi]MDQ0257750.1 hypothetical protein [Evansella vedderi]
MSKKEERFLRRLSEFPRNKMNEETKQRIEASLREEKQQTAFLAKRKERINMFKKVGAAVLTAGVLLVVVLILPNELQWNQTTPPMEEDRGQHDEEDVDRTGDDQKEEEDNQNDSSGENVENEENASNENGDSVPELNEEDVLIEYRKTTEAIFERRKDDLRIPDIDSKQEMVEYVNSVMSVELGRWFAETYFEEREDGLYVIPKDGLTYLEEDEPYEVEQVSESVYRVIQERDTDMLGHIKIIFNLAYNGENWIVDSIDSEDIS